MLLAWHATAHDICTLTMIRSFRSEWMHHRLRHREINLARAFSRARRTNRVTVREATTLETVSVRDDTLETFRNKIYKWGDNTNRAIAAHCHVPTANIIEYRRTPRCYLGHVRGYIRVYTRCPGTNGLKSECPNRLTADRTTDVLSSRAFLHNWRLVELAFSTYHKMNF